jgi:ribonuclease D
MFGIDIETTGLSLDDEVRLVQVSDGENTVVIDCRDADPRPLLEEFSEDELVAHNASFEEARLKKHFGIEFPQPLHDTMVMSQVLYGGTIKAQSMSHTLEEVAMRELGVPLNKELQTPRLGQPRALGRAVGVRRKGRRDHGAPI